MAQQTQQTMWVIFFFIFFIKKETGDKMRKLLGYRRRKFLNFEGMIGKALILKGIDK
jgi:hypothetical protein